MPINVLINDTESAPSCSTTFRYSLISVTLGDSFTINGLLRITLRTRKLLTTERGCDRRNVNDGRWQKAAGYFSALVTLVTIDGSIASRHGYHRDVTL
jgi:hypothetical protein